MTIFSTVTDNTLLDKVDVFLLLKKKIEVCGAEISLYITKDKMSTSTSFIGGAK